MSFPGNDDSIRSIRLFVRLVGQACEEGYKKWQSSIRETQSESVSYLKKKSFSNSDDKVVKSAGSSSVVQVFRSRKLVAAGTAEDVEIAMELDKEESSTKANETSVSADKSKQTTTTTKDQK